PSHSERRWAESNQWATREFTVTWEATCALIDRGIPFTLSTVEPTSAHLQAVIGYDRWRKTLIIRDPYERNRRELPADDFLDRYRAYGPRGMALVPIEQADRFDNLTLPDEPLW